MVVLDAKVDTFDAQVYLLRIFGWMSGMDTSLAAGNYEARARQNLSQ